MHDGSLHFLSALRFASDGGHLAVASSRFVNIVRIADGAVVCRVDVEGGGVNDDVLVQDVEEVGVGVEVEDTVWAVSSYRGVSIYSVRGTVECSGGGPKTLLVPRSEVGPWDHTRGALTFCRPPGVPWDVCDPMAMAYWSGVLVMRDLHNGLFMYNPDEVLMRAMSAHRTSWLLAVARAVQRRGIMQPAFTGPTLKRSKR